MGVIRAYLDPLDHTSMLRAPFPTRDVRVISSQYHEAAGKDRDMLDSTAIEIRGTPERPASAAPGVVGL
ncbi:MAG: hypothetical protein WD058_06055, partial [Dehalococcoidia bacterium]